MTIKEVAKIAGVSAASVSRFFHSPELLKEETCEKIRQVIERLDYRPNIVASNLRSQHSRNIAVLVPSLTNLYYVDLHAALRTSILENDYTLHLYTTERSPEILKRSLRNIVQGQYDGAIMCFLDEDETMDALLQVQQSIPTVLITSNPNVEGFSNVFVDAFDAMFKLVSHMVDIGRSRIAFAYAAQDSVVSREKYRGYRMALEQFNLEAYPDYLYNGKINHFQTGHMAARQFLSLPVVPDAIVCSTDDAAIGCLKCILDKGLRLPEDIALAGFNGISILSTYTPSITTVAQPIYAEAASAVNMLLEDISRPKKRKNQTIFKGTLVVAKTTVADAPENFTFTIG